LLKFKKLLTYGLESYSPEHKTVPLDPNHSHFILIDNTCNGELGFDIQFRIRLETELRTSGHCSASLLEEPSTASTNRKLSSGGVSSSLNLSLGSDKNEADVAKKSEKLNATMILICVNGGYDALRLIDESLKQNVPVLVLLVGQIYLTTYLKSLV
jgi:hypothetical protein